MLQVRESAYLKGLVSICVPTYNRPLLIKELLVSVLKQSYSNFEVIITDNSENFETQELIKREFCDPRIRYYKNPTNVGMGGNVQKAISFVRGEFFTFTPDDDVWIDRDKLRFQVDFLEKNNAIKIVYSNAESIDYHGNVLDEFSSNYRADNGSKFHLLSSNELLPGYQTEYFINILTPVIRADPLIHVFHQSWCFESEEYFCYYLAASGETIGFYTEKTVALREAEHYRTAIEDSKIVDWKKRKDLRIKQIFAIYNTLIYLYPEKKKYLETSKVNNFLAKHVLLAALSSKSFKLLINTFGACYLFFRKFSLLQTLKIRGRKGKSFG